MIDVYRRLLAKCSTYNQINQVHITLENRITPRELESLEREYLSNPTIDVVLAKNIRNLKRILFLKCGWKLQQTIVTSRIRNWKSHQWVKHISTLSAHSGKKQAEPFTRRKLSPNVSLYSDGGARSEKQLLICFTGIACRMMMPTSTFLQHLDAREVDVAMLCDTQRSGYRKGIPRLGETIESTLDSLPKLLQSDEYRSVLSMGTSSGGFPAVLAGLRLGLTSVTSIGGTGPDDPRWIDTEGVGGRELIARYIAGLKQDSAVYLVFGADCQKDKKNAEALAQTIPSMLMPVSDNLNRVDHNALLPLLHRGELKNFLTHILSSPTKSDMCSRHLRADSFTRRKTWIIV